jgi:hypothetical protein
LSHFRSNSAENFLSVDKTVDKARVVPKSLRFVTALLKKEPSDCSKIAWLTNQGTPMGMGNWGDASKLLLRLFRHQVARNVKVYRLPRRLIPAD